MILRWSRPSDVNDEFFLQLFSRQTHFLGSGYYFEVWHKKLNTTKILTLCLHTKRQATSHDETLPNQGDSGGRSVVFVVIVHVVVVVAANLGARKLHPVHNPCECKIHVVVLGVAWLLFCTAAREVAIISKSIEVIPSDSPIHGDRGYCVGQIMSAIANNIKTTTQLRGVACYLQKGCLKYPATEPLALSSSHTRRRHQ